MKGLLSFFGLVMALFVFSVKADIYDIASYHAPKIESTESFSCVYGGAATSPTVSSVQECLLFYESNPAAKAEEGSYHCSVVKAHTEIDKGGNIQCDYTWNYNGSSIPSSYYWQYTYLGSVDVRSCPPDSFPNYSYDVDFDGDGKIDKCFNPLELDSLSQCASQYNSGSMLLVGSNSASTLCKTDSSTGARCAYSLTATATTTFYTPNLEASCFGNGELPEYNEDDLTPQPPEEQCTPYGSGYVCQADPKNYCENEYSCVDGCGYVNDQFVCFRDQECTGDECAPAPVDCTNTPDAPVCKDQPDKGTPTYCDTNPTSPTCQAGSNYCKTYPTAPSCQAGTGTGGGSSFNLDYERLAQSMKDAAKTLIDEMPTPDFADTQTEIDNKTGELDEDIDNFMDGEHFNGMTQKIKENIFEGKFKLPSGGGCTAFTLGEHDFDLCDVAQRIRSMLYFVFGFLTMLYLKNLFFATVTPRKE